jgi:hypothetical protein
VTDRLGPDFKGFAPVIILEGNSQACFHNFMVIEGVTKASRARPVA